MGEKKSTYNGFTQARREANARYKAKFTELRVRMTPERMAFVKNWVAEGNADSLSSWVNSLITTALQEAGQQPPLE